jgi:septum formation protein
MARKINRLQKIDRVLLASASPRRLELLRSLGINVSVIPSSYDESSAPGSLPIELAVRHARGKLTAALHDNAALLSAEALQNAGSAIVIAADTMVDLDGTAFGKPRNHPEANLMLSALSGRKHLVHTAYAFIPMLAPKAAESAEAGDDAPKDLEIAAKPEITAEVESTWVLFHKLTSDEIEDYVATDEPMDKAGAYGIQGYASELIAGIEGDFYTVMGFPLGRFLRTLRSLGYTLR